MFPSTQITTVQSTPVERDSYNGVNRCHSTVNAFIYTEDLEMYYCKLFSSGQRSCYNDDTTDPINLTCNFYLNLTHERLQQMI